jgi:ubiquinone/menaquinone biosynthesis C-methylase UbiE
MAEVDLGRLAEAYDHRPETESEVRVAAMVEAARPGPGDLVVDVGGGRGRQASRLAEASGATVVVIDPSRPMVQASRRRGCPAAVGRGEQLPLDDATAVLTYFHLSIHHGDWRAMLGEAWRITRPGGVVFVWTMDPAYHRSSFLARWFPRVGVIDAERFPAVSDLSAALESLGGIPVLHSASVEVGRVAHEWIAAVRAGYVSTLHLLDATEIEAGLARFEAAHPDPDEVVRYRLEFTGVSSVRSSVES